MSLLDKGASNNSRSANEAASTSEELKKQVMDLDEIIEQLGMLVGINMNDNSRNHHNYVNRSNVVHINPKSQVSDTFNVSLNKASGDDWESL